METFNRSLNVIVEKHVPFLAGLLEPYANVTYLDTDEITPEAIKDAHALIIRSRTKCDKNLLEGSKVSFIVTATVGMDHIDLDYCRSRGIAAVNAPGCNAPAVAQYVMTVVTQLANRPLEQYTIGIVGVGNIGRIVARWAEGLGMDVLLCDPPRQAKEGGDHWVDLDTIAEKCDIITFHTPLTHQGEPYPTYHIADKAFFEKCKRTPLIINAARGPVTDTSALKDALRSGQVAAAAIDCWENEPDIDRELLDLAAIATTHIAGWSHEGKVRASQMALDALTAFFYLPRISLVNANVPAPAKTVTQNTLIQSFNPLRLTVALKQNPGDFEKQRNSYSYRNEPEEAATH